VVRFKQVASACSSKLQGDYEPEGEWIASLFLDISKAQDFRSLCVYKGIAFFVVTLIVTLSQVESPDQCWTAKVDFTLYLQAFDCLWSEEKKT
jgi:hypothetical protein